jgi:hypothetical protein
MAIHLLFQVQDGFEKNTDGNLCCETHAVSGSFFWCRRGDAIDASSPASGRPCISKLVAIEFRSVANNDG